MTHTIPIDSEKFEQACSILDGLAAQLCWLSMCHDMTGEHIQPSGWVIAAAFSGFEEQARLALKLITE